MADNSNNTPKSVSVGVTLALIVLPILIGGFFFVASLVESDDEEMSKKSAIGQGQERSSLTKEVAVTAEQTARVDIPLGKCIRWQGADPDDDAFSVSYLTDSGEMQEYTEGLPEMNAVVFKGNRGNQPVIVSYFLASVDSKWCSA